PLAAAASAAQKAGSLNVPVAGAGLAKARWGRLVGSRRRARKTSGGPVGGGAAIKGATRELKAGGSPMNASSASGAAMRWATKRPTLVPDTRLMTSPASQP